MSETSSILKDRALDDLELLLKPGIVEIRSARGGELLRSIAEG